MSPSNKNGAPLSKSFISFMMRRRSILVVLTTTSLLQIPTIPSLHSSPLNNDISMVLDGVNKEMDALEPAIEDLGIDNAKRIARDLTR